MNARGRALVGVSTTLVFGCIAGVLTLEQRWSVAALVWGLTLVRGYYAARQLAWAFGSDDEDDDDDDDEA